MAFYSSRVDNEGNEIERRFSARSNVSTIPSGSSRICSISSQDEDSSRQTHRIRYVNPATFIEKYVDLDDARSFDNSMNMSETQSTNSNIVPPLDLQSEDGYPTHRDYTFSYRKHVVPANKIDPVVAYNTWLSAKRKVKSDEAMQRKKIEENKIKEQEERKAKAESEYKRWLEKKAIRNAATAAVLEQQGRNRAEKARKAPPAPPPQKDTDPETIQARLIQWERQKRLQEEHRRLLKRQEEEKKRQLEEQRRRQSAEAWEKWSAGAAKKPKPVPLNRGFFSLRGTVSDIYVNPNEWQGILPEENNN